MLSRLLGIGRTKTSLFDNSKCNYVPLFLTSKSGGGACSDNQRGIFNLDLTFENHETAFKSKYTSELIRGYVVYVLCSYSTLVKYNVQVMNISKKVLGVNLFNKIMKNTIYGHFVAGENSESISPLLTRLRKYGVYPILDYSVEEDISEKEAVKREFEGIVPELERVKKGKKKCPEDPNKPQDMDDTVVPQYKYQDFGDRRKKVSSARTYFYLNEDLCDRNLDVFFKSIELVGTQAYGPGLAAVKLTALGRPQLLMQLSEVIVKARTFVAKLSDKHSLQTNVLQFHLTEEQLIKALQAHGIKNADEFLKKVIKDKEGVMHLFPWFGIIDQNLNLNETFRIPSYRLGRMVRLITQLSETEEQMFRNFIKRLKSLFSFAKNLNVPVMVDAEQTYFQPAISRITMEMMHKYNTDKLIVMNTYQCYLKNTFNEVQNDLEQARREDFYFGAKLVRGAYLTQERERAAKIGYPDPTCPDFDATTEMLHKTFNQFITHMRNYRDSGFEDRIRVMLASHNEDTVKYTIERMKQENISPSSGIIFFGQLLGMCDYISFPLGQSGYIVYKYMPYGPVSDVLPYLSRRVVENQGILEKLTKEKKLLLSELWRRIKNFQVLHKPMKDVS